MAGTFQLPIAAVWATAACEIRLFVRNPSTPILVALLLGLCILLLPANDANYTIISFGAAKPIMPATTYLLVAGVVLSTLVFPYYLLTLGIGQTRDRELAVDDLLLNSGHQRLRLIGGRIVANLIKVTLLSILLCFFISLILFAKLDQLPSGSSLVIFLMLVTSAGFFAVGPATVIEHFFAQQRSMKLLATFALWVSSVLAYGLSGLDIYGISLLESALPEGLEDSVVGFGIISGEHLTTFEWNSLPDLNAVIALAQTNLLFIGASVLAAALLVGFIRLRPKQRSLITTQSAVAAVNLDELTQYLSIPEPRFSLRSSILGQWRIILAGNFLFICLGLIVFVAGFVAPVAEFLIPVGLAGFFLLFRGSQMTMSKSACSFEGALAPLQFPNPQILKVLALTLLVVMPLLPLLLSLGAGPAAVLGSAIMLTSGWLVLTFQKWRRPMLGMSLFALFWYAFGLNSIHPNIDLLALQSFSWFALLVNISVLMVLLKALLPSKTFYHHTESQRH